MNTSAIKGIKYKMIPSLILNLFQPMWPVYRMVPTVLKSLNWKNVRKQ